MDADPPPAQTHNSREQTQFPRDVSNDNKSSRCRLVSHEVRYANQEMLEVATLSGSSSDPVDFNRSSWTTLSEDARFVWYSDQIGRMEYPPHVKVKRTWYLSGDGLLIGAGSPQA